MTVPFELFRRKPSPPLAALATDICAYREMSSGHLVQRESAALVVPIIINVGSPFHIALGRDPKAADRQPSFAAGLFAGPVHIESSGAAECVQINFTPLGAFRLFGGAVTELAGRMIDIEDILGQDGKKLLQRIGETASSERRLTLVEQFIARRINHAPSPEIAFAYGSMARSRGATRIARLAEEIGWSRKHLANRFAAEIGLPPKTVARMMRFQTACRLAHAGNAGWAEISAEAGYADQAHLVREFRELAGEPPQAWARRTAKTDSRLTLVPDF